ncbi:nucleotide exchange factor SIL1 isoform X1 [Onthophagus taurus]|uniref:nucleotide exchange factor SIL1 isoform X1 n=1 Tax=Onthophagus taurus TaxID=166361 RepID=UPI0039BE677C
MNVKVVAFLILFIALITGVQNETSKKEDDEEIFVPTHEWKIVKKGQKIPEGLHVRMNLETGVTEAKLISNDKPKNALKMIEDESNNFPEKTSSESENRKTSYKNYEELKKDFNELNLNPKTDAEILRELIEKHVDISKQKDRDEEEILTILEDLEFLVHQYDNANDFVKMDGFKTIVYHNLNATNSEIKRETLKLLGSSMQNNVNVKIHALETGSVDILLRILALDTDMSVKYRALFALSGLLRDFPYAQLKFVENAGLSVFSKLFESDNLKIQQKMLTLINDLLQEEIDSKKDTKQVEKIKQYEDIQLRKRLIVHNYCDHLNKMIVNSVVIEANDHDIIERCLGALYLMVDDCSSKLTDKSKDIVLSLRNLYRKLSQNESVDGDPDYFGTLYDLSNAIVQRIQKIKVEL